MFCLCHVSGSHSHVFLSRRINQTYAMLTGMTAFLVILGPFVVLVLATAIWAIEEHARVARRFAFRRAALARRTAAQSGGR